MSQCLALGWLSIASVEPAENVMITEVPDYSWYAGCFGSASGNLMGYWDRRGFSSFYTGPTADGVAPLSTSSTANKGIRSLWASKAGFDGRPENKPGHIDDYWTYFVDESSYSYQSTEPDPYVVAGRAEHEADCIGDFTGASQNKWANLNGECDGNIDAFAFNFWDKSGQPRTNFIPPRAAGVEVRDLQSGLLKWTEYKGHSATVISQLVDFNPEVGEGQGFTFWDLKAEIDAGYPVMLFLQDGQLSRDLEGMERANPRVHGMVAYGYAITDGGELAVRYRTSWADGDNRFRVWAPGIWETSLPLRGVILYRPKPRIMAIERRNDQLTMRWEAPASVLHDSVNDRTFPVHSYVVERADSLDSLDFAPVADPVIERSVTIADCCEGQGFYRIRLIENR